MMALRVGKDLFDYINEVKVQKSRQAMKRRVQEYTPNQASIDKLEEYFFKFEELYPASPIPMMQVYSSMKRHGISVTLDGHGADELLVGYPNLLFEFCIGNGYKVDEISNLYRDLMPKNTSPIAFPRNARSAWAMV